MVHETIAGTEKVRKARAWSRKKAATASAASLLALALAMGGCSSNSQNNSTVKAANRAASSNADTESASHFTEESSHAETGKESGDDSSIAEEPIGERGDSPPPGKRDAASQYDESKPGQLTAGEWDDSQSWKSWLRLLQSAEGQSNQTYWSIYPQRRLEVEVTSGGKPVPDAVVALTNKNGETVWEARTNNKGIAYAYAGLYDEQDSQAEYGVSVTLGEQQKRYENVPLPRGQSLKVELEKPVKAPNALDLMLLVDTTGSMEDELNYLKTELKDVVKRVDKDNGQKLGIRVSANFYRDHGDDYIVRPFPFTNEIQQAVDELSAQKAAGGGDFPEAVDEALASAIVKHEWSDSARARLLFLVLDAPPHHERKITKAIQQLTETAAAEGIRIIPVASSGVDVHTEYLMRFLATATGGTYIFLTDHSGIGKEHLKPAVGEYEVRALNDLLVEVINRYSA